MMGDATRATSPVRSGSWLDPSLVEAWSSVAAEVLEGIDEEATWEAVVHAKRALMHTAPTKEKVALLDEVGGIYHQQLQNPQKAITNASSAWIGSGRANASRNGPTRPRVASASKSASSRPRFDSNW